MEVEVRLQIDPEMVTNRVLTCRICGKRMPMFYKGCSKTYEPRHRLCIFVCSDECKEKWENQYFVEEYKGNKIYCIDGKYVPYLSCAYYFTTLEDCKKRIDKPHISYISREAWRTFIREEFVDD